MNERSVPDGGSGTAAADVLVAAFTKFICKACGLVYDEALGDADSGIAPGTRFADIPDDWVCPLCGVGKADFEPYDDAPPQRPAASPQRPAAARRGRRGAAGVVIVGAGRAGWQMAEALRRRDAALPITIVTACDGDLYDKPLLSVAHARGIDDGALVKETAGAAARRLGVRLLARTSAVRVSARDRVLRTSRGRLPYDHLVLAHGAAPRDVAVLPPTLCWRINHLAAYRQLRAALRRPGGAAPAEVIVVGAGLVGCELANDLAIAGHPVTLLDTHARPLAQWLSDAQSTALLTAWAALPLRYVGGVRVTAVVPDGAGRRVETAGGAAFRTDQVVAATGLDTPSRLGRSAGVTWRDGIAVDPATLDTGVTGVHALGDCISIDGAPVRYIEPIARQAAVIADRIASQPAPVTYRATRVPVRIKTASLGFTVDAQAPAANGLSSSPSGR